VVVGEVATSADVVVIGGGPGGYTAALRCAAGGKEVVLVERDRLGGVCLNIGCIPSKALIHAANLAHDARNGAAWGIATDVTVDLAATRSAIDGVVAQLTDGVAGLVNRAKIRVVSGSARLSNVRRVAVETANGVEHIEFEHLVIATGSRPIELPDLPFDGVGILDSTAALALTALPPSMTVIGGGYIGIELGTAFAKLGTHVSVVEAGPEILPGMPPGLARAVRSRLGELGVDVRVNCTFSASDAGHIRAAGGVIVVAVGRRPNTDGLGLEHAHISPEASGLIAVNPARRTSNAHIFAIGDITAGPALAHKATAEAEVAAATILGQKAAFQPLAIPAIVFSDPELASVGHTVATAKAAGIAATSHRAPMRSNGRALAAGAPVGSAELVADESGTIIGGHVAALNASELIAEIGLAIEMGATLTDLALTIHAHPTLGEVWADVARAAIGGTQ
jgi:dihydrolipoamide dehydrogenase